MNTYFCVFGLLLLGALSEGRITDSNTNDKIAETVNKVTRAIDSYFSNRRDKILNDISEQLVALSNSNQDQCAVNRINAIKRIQWILKDSTCKPPATLAGNFQVILRRSINTILGVSGDASIHAANVASSFNPLSVSRLRDTAANLVSQLARDTPDLFSLIQKWVSNFVQLIQNLVSCLKGQKSLEDQFQFTVNAACSEL